MATDCEFIAKLGGRFADGARVCVGLDSDYNQLPASVKAAHQSPEEAVFVFNREIVDATARYASAYKPNSAFYEALGDQGYRALKRTALYIHEHYPDIPIILDAKRADIGSTNAAYAQSIFDDLEMDAVTVHPYLGREALKPFLERKDRGIFVLAKTSNAGSGEFQDVLVSETGEPLYKLVSRHVADEWNGNGNCGLVVGATYPKELADIRALIGEMPILMPGLGAQGGDVAEAIRAGKGAKGFGLIVNSSRGIIFASAGEDFAAAAETAAAKLSGEIIAAERVAN